MATTAPPESPSPKKKAAVAKGWLVLGVAIAIAAGLFGFFNNNEQRPAGSQAGRLPATAAAPLGPAEEIDRRVREALGPSNRKPEKVAEVKVVPGRQVTVRWAVNGSPTTDLLKDFMRQDTLRTLQAVKEGAKATGTRYQEVLLSATFELTDANGKASEEVITSARYAWTTLQQTDLSKLDFKKVLDIAEESEVHRAFQY